MTVTLYRGVILTTQMWASDFTFFPPLVRWVSSNIDVLRHRLMGNECEESTTHSYCLAQAKSRSKLRSLHGSGANPIYLSLSISLFDPSNVEPVRSHATEPNTSGAAPGPDARQHRRLCWRHECDDAEPDADTRGSTTRRIASTWRRKPWSDESSSIAHAKGSGD